jgi:hypothetical protein
MSTVSTACTTACSTHGTPRSSTASSQGRTPTWEPTAGSCIMQHGSCSDLSMQAVMCIQLDNACMSSLMQDAAC